MTAVIAAAREALKGVLRMLVWRDDFAEQFDVSRSGVIFSFFAAILAIPFTAFYAGVQASLASSGEAEPFSLAYNVVRWLAAWAYFPLLAWVITLILDRRDDFGPWVVVHNWTHLLTLMVYAAPLALLASGATPLGAMLLQAAVVLKAYAYVRAAVATLNVHWTIAAAAGGANLAAAQLVDAGLARVL